MKSTRKWLAVLLMLAAFVAVAASCGPAATPAPTAAPVATQAPTTLPQANPTSTQAAAPTAVPTEAVPTATPVPEVVGTPTSPDQVPRISVEELKALMDSGAKVGVLDARPIESYQLSHIKGATPFPWKPQLTFADVEMLPFGVNLIVTYCDCGPGEADSASVALQLIELGVETEVKVLAHPSIEGWIELGYPAE